MIMFPFCSCSSCRSYYCYCCHFFPFALSSLFSCSFILLSLQRSISPPPSIWVQNWLMWLKLNSCYLLLIRNLFAWIHFAIHIRTAWKSQHKSLHNQSLSSRYSFFHFDCHNKLFSTTELCSFPGTQIVQSTRISWLYNIRRDIIVINCL